MKTTKIIILAISLHTMAGNASAVDWSSICCDGGYEYRHPNAWEKEQQRLKDELAARDREIASLRSGSSDALRSAQADLDRSKARAADLERQLADRERELASVRASAGDSSKLASQLSSTQAELDLAKGRIGDLEKSLAAAGAGASAGQLASSERDKLAAELAAANNDKNRLAGELAALQASAGDKDKLAGELAAANRRIADLEKQLADRDKELAGLRGDLSAEMAKLKEAQRGLIKALRPQIEKGTIMVDLNNERLLINLASGYLFGSGEDELKPAGADALKQVGAILKDFPEYKVSVDGHTDNRPIRSSLQKKFPTNKELSEARASNAAKALTEGGLGAATTQGFADTKPVAPNTTDAGRAKNRRVEVRVTR
ncbi:MAG TPA: OmpA family protein [Nitrospiraceae bacterium]|nr:OmpA family protein [Nitrospiraceae bacterium]